MQINLYKEGRKIKNSFLFYYGYYKYLVMLFELTYALVIY